MTNSWWMECGWKFWVFFPRLVIKESEETSFSTGSPISTHLHSAPTKPLEGKDSKMTMEPQNAATLEARAISTKLSD